jgi:hypothetical protein
VCGTGGGQRGHREQSADHLVSSLMEVLAVCAASTDIGRYRPFMQ